MKVSTKKRALPAAIRMLLLLLQHICAALVAVTLSYLLLNVGIVGEGLFDGERYYTIHPFEQASSFEESSTFYDIFRDYTEKVALGTVISSQFGTTGEVDGTTPIDIVIYANRKNGVKGDVSLSAIYELDDLLKWGMYGFSYETYTIEEMQDVYALFSKSELADGERTYMQVCDNVKAALTQNEIDFRIYTSTKTGNQALAISIPIERYKTKDNVSLKDLAKDWTEYAYLINKLESSINDLSINFDNYQKLQKDLQAESTNFRFCVEVEKSDGEKTTFSNFDLKSENDSKVFYAKNSGPVYFIWNRNSVTFDSNMSVGMYEYISSTFTKFEYALGENVQVYLTVDGKYEVNDAFRMGMEKFAVAKDIWLYAGIAIACSVIWVILLLYLSVMTGRKKIQGETQIVLNWFDYVPTEIAIVICGLVGTCLVYLFSELFHCSGQLMAWYTYQTNDLMLLVASIVAVVVSILFTFFWYSMLRRMKARTILKHSLVWRSLCWIFRRINKIYHIIRTRMEYFYTNKDDATKVILPAAFLMLLHFLIIPAGYLLLLQGSDGDEVMFVFGLAIYGVIFVIDVATALLILKDKVARTEILKHIQNIAQGEIDIRLDESKYKGENYRLAMSVNNIGNGIKTAVETSMKDERMKADLITNVSHDIKTPLTSIINYVDLLKREHIETEPVKGYIEVLDAKSQRLKQLTDDLVEASKISSGNIVLQMEQINPAELIKQALGEFSEKFDSKDLVILENYGTGEYLINADPRRMWRIIENLFNNICKYALDGTRVYIDLISNEFNDKKQVLLSIKNISAKQLNVRQEELTERFVRGDDSRTTEGSGLGLSIAKSLVEAQGGSMNIILDGDLFKVVILFDESI